jgi:hypothetical protein
MMTCIAHAPIPRGDGDRHQPHHRHQPHRARGSAGVHAETPGEPAGTARTAQQLAEDAKLHRIHLVHEGGPRRRAQSRGGVALEAQHLGHA